MAAATRTTAFTVLALIGFAANSLLCRRALGLRLIDPASFTTLRLLSGTAALALIYWFARGTRARGGNWPSAVALFLYAAAFSLSYVRIQAGIGALLLFGAVQATMLAWGLIRGERPRRTQWMGIALAVGGLVFLNLPGAQAPNRLGAALMLTAGIAWGAYSLRGRASRDPLATTADNFLRTVPLSLALSLWMWGSTRATAAGMGLAVASGALASGVGYSLWYAALPMLSRTRAAAVQLSVPVVAAIGSVLLLGEAISGRLYVAGAAILVGVWLAVRA